MKMKLVLASVLVALTLTGCGTAEQKEEAKGFETISASKEFRWSTTTPITVNLTNTKLAKVPGVSFSIWAGIPEEQMLKGAKPIVENAHFELDGSYSYVIGTTGIEKLYIQSNYIGMDSVQLAIEEGKVEYTYNYDDVPVANVKNTKAIAKKYTTAGLTFLSEYNEYGVPYSYDATTNPGGLQQVAVSDTLIAALNKAFPEQVRLSADKIGKNDVSIDLSENDADPEVKLTLVHEGAGFENSLGYYTYSGNTPTEAELANVKMVFANVETGFLNEKNQGKYLKLGATVSLGKIAKDKKIGFMLVADGWNEKNKAVDMNKTKYYSMQSKNLYGMQHIVTYSYSELNDKNENVYKTIIGIEDLTGGDDDYNDVMFYLDVKSDSPDLPDRKTETETTVVRYPEVGNKTLVYEDMWPAKGDYDFNDQVVGFNYALESERTTITETTTTTVNNVSTSITTIISETEELRKLTMNYVVRAAGAGLSSGLGIVLNIDPTAIEKVEGQKLGNWPLNMAANGVEVTTKAGESIIPVYDDADKVLAGNAPVEFINTVVGQNYYAPVTGTITITFKAGTDVEALINTFPFNPFIFRSYERGLEVHLPKNAPTSLADVSKFYTADDATVLTDAASLYKTAKNHPWALELSGDFKYPVEFCDITTAYPKFASWASSNGTQDANWQDYGVASKIYQ